jgi:signal transduction histidine kinase
LQSGKYFARTWDRFWRATASHVKGAGLGLFIAKGIIEAHHGAIWVESAGSGATFRFTLPVVESASSIVPAEFQNLASQARASA